VHKSFRGPRQGWFGHSGPIVALRPLDLVLDRGEACAIVGESGSGKSTVLRIAAGLLAPDGGKRQADPSLPPQMVFQNAVASLTPWLSIGEQIGERLRGRVRDPRERRQKTAEALERVGLDPDLAGARPAQLSGGQCQRAAIARAIIVPPSLLLCDEPISALDVSLAASILNLLAELRRQLGMALLFVTHDLAAARYIADTIMVMRQGAVVESGRADAVIANPRDPYTAELVAAVPGERRTAA
jgi:peptide/nickel transport system ATP-binding protein